MATKISKTAKIKALLDKGMTAAEIAKKLKTSPNYVYYVKWNAAKKDGKAVKAKARTRTLRNNARTPLDTPFVSDEQKADNASAPQITTWTVAMQHADPLQTQVGGEHYKTMKIQPVEYIVANNLGFLEGCIVKRISRWKSKGGFEDLNKIKHEVDLLIAQTPPWA